MILHFRKNWVFYVIGIFFLVCLGYVIFRGETMYIQVHDFLDYPIAQLTNDYDLWFADSTAKIPMLGGVSRNFGPSELKLLSWINMIFPDFPAIIVSWFLKAIVSIFSMYFLGRVIFPEYKDKRNIIILCGFLYGLIPSLPATTAFAFLPFVLGLLILIYRKPKWYYFPLLFATAFTMEFVFFGFFICGYILVFFFISWIASRKPRFQMLIALGVTSISYISTEYRLFQAFLFPTEESLRGYMEYSQVGFGQAVKEMIVGFFRGMYHAGANHSFIVLPVCFIFLVFLIVTCVKNRDRKAFFRDPFVWVMGVIILNCIVSGISGTTAFKMFLDRVIPVLSGFSFDRFLWFNAMFWYVAFLMVIVRVSEKRHRLKLEVCFLAFLAVLMGPDIYNRFLFTGLYEAMGYLRYEYPALNYREFYSSDLFEKIKEDIGYDGEWSVAYGMHPAVLSYCSIATLDGYLSYYSNEYKEKFQQLIAPELEINDKYRDYFSDWGGRAYLYSSEIHYGPVRDMGTDRAALNIDTDIFREMGGKYIFSRVLITNVEELGLEYVDTYTGENTPYEISVYKA